MTSQRTVAALLALCGLAVILVSILGIESTDRSRGSGDTGRPVSDIEVRAGRSDASGVPGRLDTPPIERRLRSGLVLVDSFTGSPLGRTAVKLSPVDSVGGEAARQLTTAESGYVGVEPGSYLVSSDEPIPVFEQAMVRVESAAQRLELECIGQLRIDYPSGGEESGFEVFVLSANADGAEEWLSRIKSSTGERLAAVLATTMEEARASDAVLTLAPGTHEVTIRAHHSYCVVAVGSGDIRVSPGASFWSVGQQVLPDGLIHYSVPPSNAPTCPVSAFISVEPGQEASVRVEALVHHSVEILLDRLSFDGGRLTLKHAETSPNGKATLWKIHGSWDYVKGPPGIARFEGCPPGTYRLTGALWTTSECTFVMKDIVVRDRGDVISIADCVGPYAIDLMSAAGGSSRRTADVRIHGNDTDPVLWRLGTKTRIELRGQHRLAGLFFRQGTVELRWVDSPDSNRHRIPFDLDRESSIFY